MFFVTAPQRRQRRACRVLFERLRGRLAHLEEVVIIFVIADGALVQFEVRILVERRLPSVCVWYFFL